MIFAAAGILLSLFYIYITLIAITGHFARKPLRHHTYAVPFYHSAVSLFGPAAGSLPPHHFSFRDAATPPSAAAILKTEKHDMRDAHDGIELFSIDRD